MYETKLTAQRRGVTFQKCVSCQALEGKGGYAIRGGYRKGESASIDLEYERDADSFVTSDEAKEFTFLQCGPYVLTKLCRGLQWPSKLAAKDANPNDIGLHESANRAKSASPKAKSQRPTLDIATSKQVSRGTFSALLMFPLPPKSS